MVLLRAANANCEPGVISRLDYSSAPFWLVAYIGSFTPGHQQFA
jgi:hypothetical protein